MSEDRAPYELPTFPVHGWDAGTGKGAVLLRFIYQPGPGEQPTQALMHTMTPAQARELARDLLNAAHDAER